MLVAVSCCAWLACGGAPTKPQNATALPSATATVAGPPKVDLSPVPMPESVVMIMHVAHPSTSADVLSAWAGQPLDAQSALGEMVGERIAKVVDLDAPADLALEAKDRGGRREPEMAFALALPVKNFEAAKAMLQGDYDVLPIDNGAFEIHRQHGEGHRRDGDSDFRSCALAPAIGGARVVCSRTASTRDALIPYLTRGTASFSGSKSDVHVEARPGPFRALAEREHSDIVQSGSRFMGRELRAVWQGAISDLLDGFLDVDKASLDANVDQTHGTAQLTISAKTSRALVTRVLSAHPDLAAAPPASFFRLPSDADFAFFEHGLDADQIAGPKETFLHALDGAMTEHESKLKESDRKAIEDAIGRTVDLMTLPVVYARGVDYAKAVPAVSGLTENSDASKIRAGVEQAAGWDVFGVDAPADKITSVLKGWSTLLTRMAATVDKNGPTLRATAAPRGAPKGTLAFALTMKHEDWNWQPSGGKPKKRPPFVLTMHTLLVPDQSTLWIVSALDEPTAVAKAKALLAANAGTLAGRSGLESLKSARMNAGGFVTPRGLGMGIPMSWLVGSPRYKVTSDPLLGVSSPTQYTTPILLTATEGASGGDHAVTLTLDMPRAALTDFLAVGPRIFH